MLLAEHPFADDMQLWQALRLSDEPFLQLSAAAHLIRDQVQAVGCKLWGQGSEHPAKCADVSILVAWAWAPEGLCVPCSKAAFMLCCLHCCPQVHIIADRGRHHACPMSAPRTT